MTRGRERGSALIPAVSLLSVLGLLASVSLLAGGADLQLAARLSRERAAFYAAESGLEETRYELGHDARSPIGEEAFLPPWPRPEVPPRQWSDGGWSLSRRIRTLPDGADSDGDPGTAIVLFNRRFGYSGSPRETGGHPVFQVIVSAESGESRQSVVAELTPTVCAPETVAAWTAGGALEITGDARISGAVHLPGGEGVEGAPPVPAIVSRGTVRLDGGAVADGLRGADGLAVVVDPGHAFPTDALRALMAGETIARLEDLPPPGEGALAGIVWSRGDYAGSFDGQGILVVHNPEFDPERYEASRLALEEGQFTAAWDASYSHLEAAHQPARLQVIRGGEFRGVIIADALGACDQPLALTGALVTLSRSPMQVSAWGTLRIAYSPGAVERAGRGPLRFMTAFKPLSGTREWAE